MNAEASASRAGLFLVAAVLGSLTSCAAPSGASLALDPRLADQSYGRAAEPGVRGAWHTFGAADFNDYILEAARSFGPGAYLWQGDGVTREIYYRDELIAKPYSAGKCHCVGATLQVYFTAFEAWDAQYGGSSGSLRGLSAEDVRQMKAIWFVSTADESGSQGALTSFGLGAAVSDLQQARSGDLAQIWRQDGSGHSVVFDSWTERDGSITAINYFSCQNSGPGFVTESVGSGPRDVIASRIYVTSPLAPVPLPDAGLPVDSGDARNDAQAPLIDRGAPVIGGEGRIGGSATGGCACRTGDAPDRTPAIAILGLWLALGRRRSRRRPGMEGR